MSYVIRLGYSPFSKSFDEQNALMAAVENGRLETVRLILSLNYQSNNEVALYKAKYHSKDKFGNNPLHLAHKRVHRDIALELEKHGVGGTGDRNLRGLVPIQMNHKKIIGGELEVDLEPDYVFIVNRVRAPLLISQLQDLKIVFKEFICKYIFLIIVISCP